jgi:predicted DNA-binding WGR domain protein
MPLHLAENADRITIMLDVVLYRLGRAAAPRFYRVEIAMNLFSEVSVLREWGIKGGAPHEVITTFGNLREASHAADEYRIRAQKRGYARAA